MTAVACGRQPGRAASAGAAVLAWALAAAMLAAAVARAAPPMADPEPVVREALRQCVAAWNSHRPAAFGRCLTEDVWFSEADDSFYKRFRGRDKVLGMFDSHIRGSDLRWEVVRLRPQADGSVAVQMRQQVGLLPLQDGRYRMSFNRDPVLARLRPDGGRWKLFFFTSDEGWARALILALDAPQPAPAAAAASPATAAEAAEAADAMPAAFTAMFGERMESCAYCHGRPPALGEDSPRARIVAQGAAAADAAGLRLAMSQPRLGGIMERVLADPALDDQRLESIRRWLQRLRDGFADVDGPRVLIRNLRASRDPPVRLDQLRAEGGWQLPADAGCRVGTELTGGASCELVVGPGQTGNLVFRLAPSPGVQPQDVTVALPRR